MPNISATDVNYSPGKLHWGIHSATYSGFLMKHKIVLAAMILIVALYLFLKATGRVRIGELEILPALVLRLVLFLISSGFFFILIAKFLRATWGYDASPLSIIIYGIGGIIAVVIAFHATRWLTDE